MTVVSELASCVGNDVQRARLLRTHFVQRARLLRRQVDVQRARLLRTQRRNTTALVLLSFYLFIVVTILVLCMLVCLVVF